MYPKADIVIFGLWDGILEDKENHTKRERRFRPVTAGKQFNELVQFLSQSNVARDVDVRFVDLMVDDIGSSYYIVKNALDAGYRLPLVMINERIRYAGGIPVKSIYNVVKAITENGCMLSY